MWWKLTNMKPMPLRRLFTAISCTAVSCMCFIIYLNSLTMPRNEELERLQPNEEISSFLGTKNVVQGVIRRKVHRDQSSAYAASAGDDEQWSAENRDFFRAWKSDMRGTVIQRNVDEQPPTAPRRHLLPSAHLTTSPEPSDRSSLLSTTNSPMYIHHARSSSNESVTTDIKPGAKSVPLSHHKEQGKHSIWPSPGEPWDDRIVQQLSFMPQRTSQSIEDDRLRTILVYSSLGATPAGREKFLRDECPVDKCTLTTDVRWIGEADAIVFPYDPGVEVRSWPPRPSHQIWVLSLLESPLNLPSINGLSNQINWTATYRLDSTIVTPYAKFVPYGKKAFHQPLPQDVTSRLRGKTKQVAWFVSNCVSGNRRMEYARDLSNYIQVDIYGECGKLRCSKSEPTQCQNLLKSHYKFFLAFENSNCQYYITEKFFNALRLVLSKL